MVIYEEKIFNFLAKTDKVFVQNSHRNYHSNSDILNDFLDKIENDEPLGIFTLQKINDKYYIIDGYSRLLSYTLLIISIINNKISLDSFLKSLKNYSPKKHKIDYLEEEKAFFDSVASNYYKLEKSFPSELVEAYDLFLNKTAMDESKLKLFVKKLLNTKAFFLISEEENSISSELYKAINQNNLPLSQTDLIEDYVFNYCKNKKIPYLFNNYFKQIKISFNKNELFEQYENFIKDYLTIQNNGKIPKTKDLYFNFKQFFKSITKIKNIEDVLKDIYRYSQYYITIIKENINDKDIKKEIIKVNVEKAYDAYPYLMEVFEDWEYNNIDKSMLLDILRTVNIFIEERQSENPSKFILSFAELSTEINRMLALKEYTPRIITEEDESFEEYL